jgi:hypothetical protein
MCTTSYNYKHLINSIVCEILYCHGRDYEQFFLSDVTFCSDQL